MENDMPKMVVLQGYVVMQLQILGMVVMQPIVMYKKIVTPLEHPLCHVKRNRVTMIFALIKNPTERVETQKSMGIPAGSCV